ncbi:DUF983 domain-containing protein [Sphingobacteriaceae bacterium]|nr:DUF983 domain-containing protein [Sphingobacteriaceae bacterium]
MVIPEIIYSTLSNRCPRCHKGQVFENNFSYNPKNTFAMHHHCSECQLKYERETGFFYGAMYVSYALMSGILIIWFITDLLFLHMEALDLAMLVVSTMLLFFPVAYRWARIIWLNFFVRYDKSYADKNFHALKELKLKQNENKYNH